MHSSSCVLACVVASSSLVSAVGAEAGGSDVGAAFFWEYDATRGQEPHEVPGSPFLCSGLGSASFPDGQAPPLRTRDADPAADGRFYYLPPEATVIESATRLRIDVTVRVLTSEAHLCATCVQVPLRVGPPPGHPGEWSLGPLTHGAHGETVQEARNSGVRRLAIGFVAHEGSPDNDEVLLLDSGAAGGPRVLGRQRVPVGVMRRYVLEVSRDEADPGQGQVQLTLPATDSAPLRARLEDLRPAADTGRFGFLFGHPASGGAGEAEWRRLRIEASGPAFPPTRHAAARADSETAPRPVTRERQLFVDDWLIDTAEGVTRRQEQPAKHLDNPVFRRQRIWEEARCELYGSAVWDPDRDRLQLFYSAMRVPYDTKMAYAESADYGATWSRPKLGLFPFDGERTNIVWPGRYMVAGPSVFRDAHDPDPARRYKLFLSDYPTGQDAETPEGGRRGIDVAFSPDGIHWTPSARNPVIPGYVSDTGQCAFRDERLDKYVAYVRIRSGGFRSVARTESHDFESWAEPRVVLTPSAADRGRSWHYYSLSVTPYEGIYIGLVWIFPQTAASVDWQADTPVTWPELVVSRDGIAWERVAFGHPFLPLGPPGSFDRRQIRTASSMVPLDDRILLVYSGSPHPHVSAHKYDIGVATLRLDGFAAIEPDGQEQGTLLTRPLLLPPGELRINASPAPGGSVKAELLDAEGKQLEGYAADECRPLETDTTDGCLSWRQHPLLPPCPDSGLRIRFVLNRTRLYSFRVRDAR